MRKFCFFSFFFILSGLCSLVLTENEAAHTFEGFPLPGCKYTLIEPATNNDESLDCVLYKRTNVAKTSCC